MPIREKSFRIGSGRYLQEKGILKSIDQEVLKIGKKPFIIGGKTALSITCKIIETRLEKSGLEYEIYKHEGSCNEEDAERLSEYAKNNGFDVIVGVGGGVIMDFAKLIGDFAKLPVINVPTSCATCAAYTPLSVRYTKEGRTVGSKHFENEVCGVIADTEIISTQPPRLLLSGVFDALAKYIEIKQRFSEETETYPIGLDWAYIMSKRSFSELTKKTEKCIEDMKNGEITDTVDQVIFATIAATGVISGIARGSNQCAIAHKFYEATRALYFEESKEYLHGEIVGIGLLLQNHFNNELSGNDFLLSLMNKYNMPANVFNIGITPTKEAKEKYYEKLKSGSAIDENNKEELKKLREGLDYLWGLG